jgi:8-oxo-dGTP pyrophosphatase MutT (NUDIX family)
MVASPSARRRSNPSAADPGYSGAVSAPPDAPTHAGGVVIRHRDGLPEVLVISGRRHRNLWVLPKGAIASGEDPAATAIREVRTEAGVVADIAATLEDTDLQVGGEHQRVRWFLMESSSQGEADELREVVWLDADAALARLTFPDARILVEHALAALAATSETGL